MIKTQVRVVGKKETRTVIYDEEDRDLFLSRNWFINMYGYCRAYVPAAERTGKRPKYTSLHREVIQAKHKQHVDHVNGNKLDNRRKNLRLCTAWHNHQNLNVVGMSWNKYAAMWVSYIEFRGRQINLGFYNQPESAAAAYYVASKLLRGPFARELHLDSLVAEKVNGRAKAR